MEGYIHSIESFGTVDGPGVRLVIFLQCFPMRCLYCHNPASSKPGRWQLMTTDEILEKYDRYKEFLKSGGITATGGEPMLQMEFLIELFTKAKAKGIHTCLDTSGICFDPQHPQDVQRLAAVTDLVMLDIKHIDEDKHKKLTGHSNRKIGSRTLDPACCRSRMDGQCGRAAKARLFHRRSENPESTRCSAVP